MIDTLRQYESDGLLYSQVHPTLPLIIWNYTQKVQYEGLWDDVTITARGLVTNTDGKIVSRGFPKFFNIEEGKHTATNDFQVFEKLDGQYIGVFWYNGGMVVNSRGSFTSPYAIEARRILNEKYSEFVDKFDPHKGSIKVYPFTFCFELIGFEQIVVSYSETNLILTGIISNKTGVDGFPWRLIKYGLTKVKKYDGFDYTKLKELNWENSEGFVVRFSNGDRCKIKFEDYVRLHRQMTNLSTTAIWEALSTGSPISSILTDVPDEFFSEVNKIEKLFNDQFSEIEHLCKTLMMGTNNLSQKEFAEMALQTNYSNILFSMRSGKDYFASIWKMIKPEFKKI